MVEIVALVHAGASLIEFTLRVTVPLLDAYDIPSYPFRPNEAVPL